MRSNTSPGYNDGNPWWGPLEKELANLKLGSFHVKCPRCHRQGIVVSRWVKGLSEKPKYILHSKDKKVEKACKLTTGQAKKICSETKITKGDISSLLKNRKGFVLFSGGTDSLCLLAYLKEVIGKANYALTVLHVDTTAGLPANTKYVRKICNYLGLRLKIVKPNEDYFSLVKRWGIPSFRSRWCCRELKIKPIRDYLETIKQPKIVFDGIRAVESRVRENYLPIWYHPSFKCLSVSPIFYWSDKKKETFLNHKDLPINPVSSFGCSVECWCGAYKRESDFKKLYGIDKSLFKRLMKVEEQNKNGYTFVYKNGRRIPLRTLIPPTGKEI